MIVQDQLYRNIASYSYRKQIRSMKIPLCSAATFHSLVAVVDLISDWRPVQLSMTHEMNLKGVKMYENYIYISRRPWSPEIGDLRIKYEFAGATDPANPTHVRNTSCTFFISYSKLAGRIVFVLLMY